MQKAKRVEAERHSNRRDNEILEKELENVGLKLQIKIQENQKLRSSVDGLKAQSMKNEECGSTCCGLHASSE